jgi:exodeoxyribonuclease VII large subunit
MAKNDEQWQLFGGDKPPKAKVEKREAPAAPEEPTAYSVSAFNEAVGRYLEGLFPRKFRIQGFVSGFNRSWSRGAHVYFDLVERDPADESRSLSTASMVIWRGRRGRLQRDLEALAGPGGELDDMQVTFEVSVNFYVPRGRLSLIVEGIDLEASLGAQKLDRERILKMLAAEDLIEANSRLPLSDLPLRLALVTSLESAAYHDFVKELENSGLAFHLSCIDARVQGSEQEAAMTAAFATLRRRAAEFDAVVLIRGGGSRSDLAGFDAEALAREIALCPLPVLTGIGHEIDRSIADEVAHHAFKTPTAVAQWLTRRVEEWLDRLDERAAEIRRSGERRLLMERRRLDRSGHALRGAALARIGKQRERLSAPRTGLPMLARQILRLYRMELEQRGRGLSPTRLLARLARDGERLERRVRRLGDASQNTMNTRRRLLERREGELRLLDPQLVLRRGFSLTRDAQGRLLRSSVDLKPGERIVTTLAEGQIESEVRALGPAPNEIKEGDGP